MSQSEAIRVMIVDDHPVVRAGIRAILSSHPDMDVIGDYGRAEEAIEAYGRVRADVVLMDLQMPGIGGIAGIGELQRRYGGIVRILVLTTYEGDDDVRQALQAGASAYLIKGMDYERLIQGIRRLHAGKTYVPAEVLKMAGPTLSTGLSNRERQVLTLIANGMGNRAIAADLGISESTVKSHVGVILTHFQVHDRTQAVVAALRRGYVRL